MTLKNLTASDARWRAKEIASIVLSNTGGIRGLEDVLENYNIASRKRLLKALQEVSAELWEQAQSEHSGGPK